MMNRRASGCLSNLTRGRVASVVRRGDARAANGIRGRGVEPRRWHRICAIAPERKPDLAELVAVAVETPDNYAGQPGACCLERGEVADAGLVVAAAVVDDQDVAVLGGF